MAKHQLNYNQVNPVLNALSTEINQLYGFVNIEGENFGEPSINSGPCGPVAQLFFELWNQKFKDKVNIVFIWTKDKTECWHILIRLPTRQLFDGGYGVHDEAKYQN